MTESHACRFVRAAVAADKALAAAEKEVAKAAKKNKKK